VNPELRRLVQRLVREGLVEQYLVNGVVYFRITEQGRAALQRAEETVGEDIPATPRNIWTGRATRL
jgi:DNA-binding PadR family transcriptional regulator